MSANPVAAPLQPTLLEPVSRKPVRRVRWRIWIRLFVAVLVIGGVAFGWKQFRRSKQIADLPTAAARRGDFLVIVRCRGELSARRSEQLTAPLDIPDLQIVWLAPPGGAVKEGEVVVRFDPSKAQQDLKRRAPRSSRRRPLLSRRRLRRGSLPIRTISISRPRNTPSRRRSSKPRNRRSSAFFRARRAN